MISIRTKPEPIISHLKKHPSPPGLRCLSTSLVVFLRFLSEHNSSTSLIQTRCLPFLRAPRLFQTSFNFKSCSPLREGANTAPPTLPQAAAIVLDHIGVETSSIRTCFLPLSPPPDLFESKLHDIFPVNTYSRIFSFKSTMW